MQTKLFTLSVLSVLILAGAGCSASKETSSVKNDDQGKTPEKTEVVVAPKACGEDLACGNELLSDCKLGSFTTMDGRAKVTVVIKSKADDKCVMSNSLSTVAMMGYIDQYDLNKDAAVDMECNVPTSVKDFTALSAYVKTPAGLATCTGEMKTMSESL